MSKLGMSLLRIGVLVIVVMIGVCWMGQTATAQNATPSVVSEQQQLTQQSDEQKAEPETKTFTGKIVKSGDMFILSDEQNKVTYKLDDQAKAKEFENRDVKVTGVLDDSTGVIRVSAIEPA